MKIHLVSSETTNTSSNLVFTNGKRNRTCKLTVQVGVFDSYSIGKNILLNACRSLQIV